ncbi:MAG: hypothetical protein QOE33_1605 [Acidobacteriota bacterium]|nr:hypothetical protein [Acidobacteriota bacterium]
MRSKLSFITAACFIITTLVAVSGCANKAADANNANAAMSPAASGASQTIAQGQSPPSGQTNVPSAASNTAVTGQSAGASTSNATSATGAQKNVDACALLTSDDIKAVQGEPVKEAKPSRRDDPSLQVSQCFFTTATFNKSVSLELTASADGKSARRLWDERFGHAREEGGKSEREREKRERDKRKTEQHGGEEEEEGPPPTPIKGLGDEAYWASSRVNGTLYARKGDSFVRVSIGGADDDVARQRKAKALAQRALARL